MKSEGIRTLVRKLRLCQSARGRKRTRVERLVLAPASEAWRTTFLRLFLGKRIGTFAKAYKPASAKQNLLRRCALCHVERSETSFSVRQESEDGKIGRKSVGKGKLKHPGAHQSS